MSLTVFLSLSILGLAFMVYVLFKLLYGDRRSLIAHRVAEQRKADRAEDSGLFLVLAKKSSASPQELDGSSCSRASTTKPQKLFTRSSYHTRIA
jgi:hypothetical protein